MNRIEATAIKIFKMIEPDAKIQVDYERFEDVLYITFLQSEPIAPDYGVRLDDYIVRIRQGYIVGVTILNATEHFHKHFEDRPPILRKPVAVFA